MTIAYPYENPDDGGDDHGIGDAVKEAKGYSEYEINLSDEDYEDFKKLAEARGLTIEQYMERAIHAYIREYLDKN